jgi:transcriptional regulator with XRE-family HTH domain
MALRDRISAIMEEHGLTRREMAAGLDTSPDTLKGWLQGKTPPAVLGPMLDLLEGKREAMRGWRRLGIERIKLRPRGRPFQRGNPWRFGDPRRSELNKKEKHQ